MVNTLRKRLNFIVETIGETRVEGEDSDEREELTAKNLGENVLTVTLNKNIKIGHNKGGPDITAVLLVDVNES